jgi:hypothetical protein
MRRAKSCKISVALPGRFRQDGRVVALIRWSRSGVVELLTECAAGDRVPETDVGKTNLCAAIYQQLSE